MNSVQGVRHFLLALQFFTRIPVTGRLAQWVGYNSAMLRASAGHFPGVGWVVGAVGALVLWGALRVLPGGALGALVAAAFSTLATVWLTGAFHEDGMADTADGLGGAVTRERALAIMKDSRIGTYGAAALVLVLALKLALLALLAQERGAAVAAAVLLAGHVLSRFAPLLLMRALPYVGDADGSKSKPLADAVPRGGVLVGLVWSIPALALMVLALGAFNTVAAALLWALALLGMKRLLARRLQGFTGDTLGATQQACEVAMLLGAVLVWPA